MHFQVCRVEPRAGRKHECVFPVAYVRADCDATAEEILCGLPIVIRGNERLILLQIHNREEVRQTKAIDRERRSAAEDARRVIDHILNYSVD
jgi:hypothetical protein